MLLAWIAVRRVSSLYVQSVFSLPPAQIKEVSPGTLDSIAKECNGVRAQAQLQQLPTALDTYKQHADKMYPHRYLLKLPSINDCVRNQATGDHPKSIRDGTDYLKDDTRKKTEGHRRRQRRRTSRQECPNGPRQHRLSLCLGHGQEAALGI
ncbi:hypothetical protein MY10362_007904 [Beauveria mimosiformis]